MSDKQRVHVTQHAIERYIERVAPVTPEQAAQAMDCAAVRAAAEFGARFVRLHGGQRIAVQDWTVVTVLPADNHRKQVGRRGIGRYGSSGRIGERFDEVE